MLTQQTTSQDLTLQITTQNVTLTFCLHDASEYIGLTERYYYCLKCGEKLDE
jgi:hypothetical protein